MGRKRKNAVYAFFSYDKDTNSSTCLVTGCSTNIVKGQHGTNLLYHLSTKHPEEHKIVCERNRLIQDELQTETENNANAANTSADSIAGQCGPSAKKIEYLKTQCVNMVTVHGRPFAIIDDLAFRNIISMTSINPRDLQAVNSHSIKALITQAAEKKRADIAAQIKGRLISLKVDSATRLDRAFFAVNAQFIENGSIRIKHLGVTELHSRSTAEYLKEKLLYILRKYKIEVDQIYTITTDNGANMIKMARLLNETEQEDENYDDLNEEIDIEPLEITLDERDCNSSEAVTHTVKSIRCAAHTLQLAVHDALREDESIYAVDDARQIARKLRTPTMRNVLKAAKKKIPTLDVSTRWHSTLDMLEGVEELKEYCSETPGDLLYVSNITWDAIKDQIKSLKPAKILTKILQEEQLTVGDFYYHWSKCYFATSHVLVPLAQNICYAMKTREKELMTSPTFVSAIYLDPRFQVVLSAEEEGVAVRHLITTWAQILKLDAKHIIDTDLNVEFDQLQPNSHPDVNLEDEMEVVLSQTELLKRRSQRHSYVQNRVNITEVIENFSRYPRLPTSQDIFSFWEKIASSEPKLFRLANVILATPVTQVSVERFFSSLRYVLHDLRFNLNDKMVEDILILRNNN